MKKLLIIFLVLLASCAKQPVKLEPTGFAIKENTAFNQKIITPKKVIKAKSLHTAKNNAKSVVSSKNTNLVKSHTTYLKNSNDVAKINNNYLSDSKYQNKIKQSLAQKIQQKGEISELFEKIKNEKNTSQSVSLLKPETPVLEKPLDLEDLTAGPTLKQKIYNLTLKPIQKQIIKWNIFINKQINKYMMHLKHNHTIWVVLVSLFAAFIYGVLHTLGPGHGKMVVVTYFLTQKASFIQGVFLGLQTAFAHVMGAIVLIFATNIVLHSFILNPEDKIHLLKNISFSLIIVIGIIMFIRAILHALGKIDSVCTKCGHSHDHNNHAHNHSGEHIHVHEDEDKHKHEREHKHAKNTTTQSFIALAIGCVPCTGSLLILLYAMANNMLMLGLLMVIFVALGMATTMIFLGILAILGKQKILDKKLVKSKNGHKYIIVLEFAGAIFIIVLASLLLMANV